MKQFVRRREDFICEHCGTKVVGDGYTNHCPKCLWSKHVDIMPGDRAEDCQGLMRPIDIKQTRDGYIITHKCEKCEALRNNKSSPNDDFEALLQLAREQVNKLKN